MDKEIYDALYRDVICKTYCDIEVPSRVLELQHLGIGFTEAVRQVMLERVAEYVDKGVIDIPLTQLKELTDDLRRGSYHPIKAPLGSVNLNRVMDRVKNKLGGYRRKGAITVSGRVTTEERFRIEEVARGAGKSVSMVVTDVLRLWLNGNFTEEEK